MKTAIFLSLLSFSVLCLEAKAAAPKEVAVTYPELSDIRCEKLQGHSLADFKKKLVENCDLNKPYSSSMSRLLNEETYFYCCQIRK